MICNEIKASQFVTVLLQITTADNIFRYGMNDMKVSSAVALAIHTAVRVGG